MRDWLLQILLCGAFFGSTCVSPAQEFNSSTNSPLQQIAPGIFQIGSVRLNKEKKTIQFPASVNMTNGLVEYFLVSRIGKLHESVLKTDAEPTQIHLAMLLIGGQGAADISNTNAISGDRFTIEVSWTNHEVEKRVRAESTIFNLQTQSLMSEGVWVYNGSKIVNQTFIAQRDGSIVAIITDPLALANNPRAGQENDKIWQVATNSLPPVNSAVEVTFKLVD